MKKNNKIPIVMLSDENYIFQTRVAIWSMRKNTPVETVLEITILCSKELDNNSRQMLIELQNILDNIKIAFYEVDKALFVEARVIGQIPMTSYYRLIIGEAIKEEKCLFLDGDMIINVDLNNIFSIDIADNYIAGVRELGFLQNLEKAERHRSQYGFLSLNTYVNAGVMIFNLNKIRKDNLQNIFIREIASQYTYMDQDILNKVCFGKIKLLEPKYNVPNCHVHFSKLVLDQTISLEQIKDAQEHWKILHFIGNYKPWENIRTWGASIWWGYAKEALDNDIYEAMYFKAMQCTLQSDWSYILDKCKNITEIILVGYGNLCMDIYESLLRCGVKANFYFCDNSVEKQKLSNDKIKIYSVTELAETCLNALWIITAQVSYSEINCQLRSLGIAEEKILVYKHKTEVYYDRLDEKFLEYENKQFQIKTYGLI